MIRQILAPWGMVQAQGARLQRVVLAVAGPSPAPETGAQYAALEARLDALVEEVRHLEAALEGLQDSVHRRSQLDDRRNDMLLRRTDPHGDVREPRDADGSESP